MASRRGFTLIEAVIVSTLAAVILGLAVAATGAVSALSLSTSREADLHHELLRLASAFRDDVHRSEKVVAAHAEAVAVNQVAGEPVVLCELALAGGGRVRYLLQNGLLREMQTADGKLARDGFALSSGQEVMIQTTKDGAETVALLVRGTSAVSLAERAAGRGRVWQVRATLGRDRLE